MAGLALGQIAVGPVADKYGRKRPLVSSLVLFALSTVGCMLSWGIAPLILFRVLQGGTGASWLVISRALVADEFKGEEAARYFALFATLLGVAPIVALLVGGATFSLSSWRGTFAVLGLWGLWLAYECSRLDETLGESERLLVPLGRAFMGYLAVLHNGSFMALTLMFGFANAALMSYISASPFIFQRHYGLTAMQYSLVFALNAVALVLGSVLVMRWKNLLRDKALGSYGLLAGCVLSATALALEMPLAVFEGAVVILLFSIGVLTPVTVTLAMASAPEHRGMASALVGALPFLVSGVAAPLTGLGNMLRSTAVLLVVCSLLCALMHVGSRRLSFVEGEKGASRG